MRANLVKTILRPDQLVWDCVGWPNGEKLAREFELDQSERSHQVIVSAVSRGKTGSQVPTSFKLAINNLRLRLAAALLTQQTWLPGSSCLISLPNVSLSRTEYYRNWEKHDSSHRESQMHSMTLRSAHFFESSHEAWFSWMAVYRTWVEFWSVHQYWYWSQFNDHSMASVLPWFLKRAVIFFFPNITDSYFYLVFCTGGFL